MAEGIAIALLALVTVPVQADATVCVSAEDCTTVDTPAAPSCSAVLDPQAWAEDPLFPIVGPLGTAEAEVVLGIVDRVASCLG